jgi:hypothetical protein
VVTDHLEGGAGADALNGVEIIAAEENTEVDELIKVS